EHHDRPKPYPEPPPPALEETKQPPSPPAAKIDIVPEPAIEATAQPATNDLIPFQQPAAVEPPAFATKQTIKKAAPRLIPPKKKAIVEKEAQEIKPPKEKIHAKQEMMQFEPITSGRIEKSVTTMLERPD